jgi:hypothetical protein
MKSLVVVVYERYHHPIVLFLKFTEFKFTKSYQFWRLRVLIVLSIKTLVNFNFEMYHIIFRSAENKACYEQGIVFLFDYFCFQFHFPCVCLLFSCKRSDLFLSFFLIFVFCSMQRLSLFFIHLYIVWVLSNFPIRITISHPLYLLIIKLAYSFLIKLIKTPKVDIKNCKGALLSAKEIKIW